MNEFWLIVILIALTNLPIMILFFVQNFVLFRFVARALEQIEEMKQETKKQIENEFKKMY